MNELEEKRLSLLRLIAFLLAALLLITVCACVLGYRALSPRAAELDRALSSVSSLAKELDRIDFAALSSTVDGITAALDEQKLSTISSQLAEVSASLAAIDWEALAVDASESMRLAQESLTQVMAALDSMDIDTLNAAIVDLKTVIDPLAHLMGRG